MINLGEYQELIIKRIVSIGAFLNEEKKVDDDVLLPRADLPKDKKVGDKIRVFIYNDSKGRYMATTKEPKITLGEIAPLKVVDVSKIGIFLDWGLEKDLFLPFGETIGSVDKGRTYLVGLYVDKSGRLCATMKIRDMLRTDSDYKEDDIVKGTIYSIHRNIGAFVAVDNKYDALIPKKELLGVYEVGDQVEARVTRVQNDGKLDLSLRDKFYLQIDKDAERVLEILKERGGSLNLGDKSQADLIREELHMSKSGFKRAIGKLYKDGVIQISDYQINLNE